WYDPHVGRFVSEDPIDFRGGDINLYAYVKNRPLMFRDPTGLWRCDPRVSAAVGFVGGGVVGYVGGTLLGGPIGAAVGVLVGGGGGSFVGPEGTVIGGGGGGLAVSVWELWLVLMLEPELERESVRILDIAFVVAARPLARELNQSP